jgi:hypothetical protein
VLPDSALAENLGHSSSGDKYPYEKAMENPPLALVVLETLPMADGQLAPLRA